MTIDEAIKHAEEVADTNERLCETAHPAMQLSNYGKCAREHRQLAEWLKELKRLKRQMSSSKDLNSWIPVSERLPKDEEYVLVCYSNGDIRTAYYYIDTSVYETEFEDSCDTGWYDYTEEFMLDQDVIAWQPLPQPYNMESEEIV